MSDSAEPTIENDDISDVDELTQEVDNIAWTTEVDTTEEALEPVKVDGYELNDEQLRVYNAIMKKLENEAQPFHLFVSGEAGTGKSLLLKALQNAVIDKHGSDFYLSTAPTAGAAELINANTLNSAFLIPWQADGQSRINQLYAKLRKVKVLLIDVINYVSAETFKEIDSRMKNAINTTKPFGGVSVIVFGDFFQLQPSEGRLVYNDLGPENLWSLFKLFELTENEKVLDPEKQNILSLIRSTMPSEDTTAYLRNCEMKDGEIDIVQTLSKLREDDTWENLAILTQTEPSAESFNQKILSQYNDIKVYHPMNCVDNLTERRDEYSLAGDYKSRDLIIGVGATVVLTCYYDHNFQGNNGTVLSYTDDTVTVRLCEVIKKIQRVGWFDGNYGWKQFPLRFVGAFTIHEAQGMSFERVLLNEVESMFVGQFYTALSRARFLNHCLIPPNQPLTWEMPSEAAAEMARLREHALFEIDQ